MKRWNKEWERIGERIYESEKTWVNERVEMREREEINKKTYPTKLWNNEHSLYSLMILLLKFSYKLK